MSNRYSQWGAELARSSFQTEKRKFESEPDFIIVQSEKMNQRRYRSFSIPQDGYERVNRK